MTLRLLEQVRDQLKACNAVRSEREFCEQWLGKSECYMRSLRFNHMHPSADAMMMCASKLGWHARHLKGSTQSHHTHWAGVFATLRTKCVDAAEARAQHKWRNGSAAA